MPEDTQITAIIPSKGRFDMVKRLVGNLRSQNFDQHSIEIIIVDDGSEPRYEFEPGDHITLIRHDKSIGAQISRNDAIAMAKGRYILMLDDDIEFTSPDYIQKSVDILEKDDEIAAVFPRQMVIRYLDNDKIERYEQLFSKTSAFTGEFIQSDIKQGPIQWGHQVYLVRTDLLRDTGGFDSIFGLKGGHSFREESDVQAKLRKSGHKLWLDKSLSFNHHIVQTGGHGSNIGKRLYWIAHNHIIFTRRHLKCWPLKVIGFSYHILRYSYVQGRFKYLLPMVKGYCAGIRNALRDQYPDKNQWI
ncbi:MAG: glycosyltransferase family 2 protein [Phycisphaerae bacterium]|nr:glycosyltransferase family 2 protein [Phycisphaerae bacterium]